MPVLSLSVQTNCCSSAEPHVLFDRASTAFSVLASGNKTVKALTLPSIASCAFLADQIFDLVEKSPLPRGAAALAIMLAQARAISFDDYVVVVNRIVCQAEAGRISPQLLFNSLGVDRSPCGTSTLLDEGSESFRVLGTRSEGLARRMVNFLPKWFAECDSNLELRGGWRAAAGLFLALSPAEMKLTIDRCIGEIAVPK